MERMQSDYQKEFQVLTQECSVKALFTQREDIKTTKRLDIKEQDQLDLKTQQTITSRDQLGTRELMIKHMDNLWRDLTTDQGTITTTKISKETETTTKEMTATITIQDSNRCGDNHTNNHKTIHTITINKATTSNKIIIGRINITIPTTKVTNNQDINNTLDTKWRLNNNSNHSKNKLSLP